MPALPEPTLTDWAKLVAVKQRFPIERRRLKWRASWQFEQIVTRLTSSDVVIDCGASNGRCTGLLAANGATVYAFEPDPHGFAGLEAMFRGVPNVHLLRQAVGLDVRQAALYRHAKFADNPNRFVQSSSLFTARDNGQEFVMVDQIDFPAFIQALSCRIAILKLDIEGAEVPILERLLDTGLIERFDYVFAETHERVIPALVERTMALRTRVASLRNINLDWI
jgi:FkbM family methyltransferase